MGHRKACQPGGVDIASRGLMAKAVGPGAAEDASEPLAPPRPPIRATSADTVASVFQTLTLGCAAPLLRQRGQALREIHQLLSADAAGRYHR
jgi:hypothetical protein